MKNTTILMIAAIFLIGAGFFLWNSGGKGSTGEVVKENLVGDFQEVKIGFKEGNYYPNTVEVEAGKPVRVTLDESVRGCYRAFTIRSLAVSKYSSTPADKIEFTPKEKGTYTFSCSMGMGYGKLLVK